jgi:TRAP-type mannitol/chloroaromatic compound transport system substrate-binding protein
MAHGDEIRGRARAAGRHIVTLGAVPRGVNRATNLLHVSAVELVKMVEEMSGGRLKWEMSAAGAVVGTFEVVVVAHDWQK